MQACTPRMTRSCRSWSASVGPQAVESPRDHCRSRPPISEIEATLRACEFARETGVRLHVHHVRSRAASRSCSAIRREGCAHYRGDLPALPPLDDRRHGPPASQGQSTPRCASGPTWRGCGPTWPPAGSILVASDHAPWPPESKSKPDIFENGSGAPGVQTLVPLLYSEGVAKGRISLGRFVEVLSPECRPGLRSAADERGAPVRAPMPTSCCSTPRNAGSSAMSRCSRDARWSPFEGMTVQGAVVATVVRGVFAYRDGELLAKPGDGQFVPGAAPGTA